MPKEQLFEKNYIYYDKWFDEHHQIYTTEMQAIKKILPKFTKGIEIGVGTGRFSKPLGIDVGIEPSTKMAQIAQKRGIHVIHAYAEDLPLQDSSFDLVLMVTTICFVDDIDKTLQEAKRILQKEGYIIVAFVDKDSALGKLYEKNKEKSRFYKDATFFSKDEVVNLLQKHGFTIEECVEALFGDTLKNLEYAIYDGCTRGGAFLVIKAKK